MLVPGGVRNRSPTAMVNTPGGQVEVVRQEMQGLHQRRAWTWFWLARRKGRADWSEASTALEGIRRAVLLPPRKPRAWLSHVADKAVQELTADAVDDR